jgi:hypothetical protein
MGERGRIGVLVCLAMAATVGVLVTPAHAAEVLPVTSVSPANGATIPLPTEGIRFEIQSPIVFNSPECVGLPYLAVSSQNVLNQIPGSRDEGHLATDFQVDFRQTVPSQAYPGLLWAVSNFVPNGRWWSSTPGTYYWQVEGSCLVGSREYLSPVYSLTIAPPAPAPSPPPVAPAATPHLLSVEEAYLSIKSIIRESTGRSAHRLSDRCTSRNTYAVACKAGWASTVHLSSSTLLYSGNFFLEQQSNGFHTSFIGHRERSGCKRRLGVRRCASNVHWHHVY